MNLLNKCKEKCYIGYGRRDYTPYTKHACIAPSVEIIVVKLKIPCTLIRVMETTSFHHIAYISVH